MTPVCPVPTILTCRYLHITILETFSIKFEEHTFIVGILYYMPHFEETIVPVRRSSAVHHELEPKMGGVHCCIAISTEKPGMWNGCNVTSRVF